LFEKNCLKKIFASGQGMNSKGMLNIFILIVIALIAVIALPAIIMMLIPEADLIIRIILVFLIFMTVRGYLGSGIPTIIITGVLVYFLVIKWAYFTTMAYVALFFLLGLQVFSIIIFGIGMGMRK
jgi:hypothetical protein